MTEVLLHGQFRDFLSNANVSRGYAHGLSQNDLRVVIGDGGAIGLDWMDLQKVHLEHDAEASDFHVGGFVGYPPHALCRGPLDEHEVKVGMFIAESSRIPSLWGMLANGCDVVAVPSPWTAVAYINAGVDEKKVIVVPHGLPPAFSIPGVQVTSPEGLEFLHVAGARDFLERKGTPQLVTAFSNVFGRTGKLRDVSAKLTIRTPYSIQILTMISATGNIHLFDLDTHVDGMRPLAMRKYLLRDGRKYGWSAIIQPSRAEAFGLLPVEARALGIPVIMTQCSGHAQHVEGWDTIIEHGAEENLAVNGIPNGSAPTVSVEAIEDALVRFVVETSSKTEAAAKGAVGYWEKYDWKVVTEKLAKEIEAHA